MTLTDRLSGRSRLPLAGRAFAQRAVRLELLLHGPGALFESPPQVGDHAFEVAAERIGFAFFLRLVASPAPSRFGGIGARRTGAAWPAAAGPNSTRSRCFFGSLPNGTVGSMPWYVAIACDGVAHHPLVALAPRRDRAVDERLGLIRHDALRIEVPRRAETLALGTGAMRRVERERARRHLGHAQAADDAGELAREQPVAAVERVDRRRRRRRGPSATSTDSASRRSMPLRTISRSTTISMV